MVLARWASYNKKRLARQVIPLGLGYRTALSSCPGQTVSICLNPYFIVIEGTGVEMAFCAWVNITLRHTLFVFFLT